MTGEPREDITLYTDDADLWNETKTDIEETIGTELSKPQALRALIKDSDYGPSP